MSERKRRKEPHYYLREQRTPLSQIPQEYQMTATLPGGDIQIVDTRLCYNWQPSPKGKGRLVECGSVAADADKLKG
ncbi:MAG: hypothetical protein PVJ09_00485 [Candidatus Woesebacteria bacterium]|jgi:hypothetical protein